MCTRGYAKHPCTQFAYSQGVAVSPIRAYPLKQISMLVEHRNSLQV